jgi:peptidoglycan/LPS O-acetylase OafA/YrhL
MTGIIVRELENPLLENNSWIWRFYLARAKRIIPALAVLCMVLIAMGWFVLSSLEYSALGVDIARALTFVSNFGFWKEAGYFDAASHEKLLLHTWSLSVEWQFYLILPLVLMGLWKVCRRRLFLLTMFVSGLVVSIGLSIYLSGRQPSMAFYLLPTRAWEMLAGGIVYLLADKNSFTSKQQKIVEVFGFFLVISSILVFDGASRWPGWWAILPVAGSMLILMAARQGSFWTGSSVAQWLGKCSYSLYLWHWPIVVVLTSLRIKNNPYAIFTGLLLTLIFGWISHKYIENIVGKNVIIDNNKIFLFRLVGSSVIVIILGISIKFYDGVPQRLAIGVDIIFNETMNINPRRGECHVSGKSKVPGCTYGGAELGVIVLGDSHASSMMSAIENALPEKKMHVLDWSFSGCRTISGVKKVSDPSNYCVNFVDWAIKEQKNFPSNIPLVIINRTSIEAFGQNEFTLSQRVQKPDIYFDRPFDIRTDKFYKQLSSKIVATACEISKTRQVFMIRPFPELKLNVPKTIGRAKMMGNDVDVLISMEEYKSRNDFVWNAQNIARETLI